MGRSKKDSKGHNDHHQKDRRGSKGSKEHEKEKHEDHEKRKSKEHRRDSHGHSGHEDRRRSHDHDRHSGHEDHHDHDHERDRRRSNDSESQSRSRSSYIYSNESHPSQSSYSHNEETKRRSHDRNANDFVPIVLSVPLPDNHTGHAHPVHIQLPAPQPLGHNYGHSARLQEVYPLDNRERRGSLDNRERRGSYENNNARRGSYENNDGRRSSYDNRERRGSNDSDNPGQHQHHERWYFFWPPDKHGQPGQPNQEFPGPQQPLPPPPPSVPPTGPAPQKLQIEIIQRPKPKPETENPAQQSGVVPQSQPITCPSRVVVPQQLKKTPTQATIPSQIKNAKTQIVQGKNTQTQVAIPATSSMMLPQGKKIQTEAPPIQTKISKMFYSPEDIQKKTTQTVKTEAIETQTDFSGPYSKKGKGGIEDQLEIQQWLDPTVSQGMSIPLTQQTQTLQYSQRYPPSNKYPQRTQKPVVAEPSPSWESTAYSYPYPANPNANKEYYAVNSRPRRSDPALEDPYEEFEEYLRRKENSPQAKSPRGSVISEFLASVLPENENASPSPLVQEVYKVLMNTCQRCGIGQFKKKTTPSGYVAAVLLFPFGTIACMSKKCCVMECCSYCGHARPKESKK